MVAPDKGGWITVKARNAHRKVPEFQHIKRETERGHLSGILEGDRQGREEADRFEDVTRSSASHTETSSYTSRSASPSSGIANGSTGEQFRVIPKNKKKQKTRRQKTSPKDIPVSVNEIKDAIAEAKFRYEDDQSQLGFVTDFFITHYRSSELPFNKTLHEQPLSKAAEIPLEAVPSEVVQLALDFYRSFDLPHLSALVRTLVDALFSSAPESSTAAPAKAQVGLLVSVALVLRASPAAAILLSDALVTAGARYSGPQRLPYLLWMLAQAAIGDVSVGVAVWVRVLLPQVLGVQLAGGKAAAAPPKLGDEPAAAALNFLDLCLAAVRPADEPVELNRRGYPKWNPGTVALEPEENALVHAARQGFKLHTGKRGVEPVVPPAALDAIARLTFQTKPVLRAKNNAHLHRHYERLLDLGLEGAANGGFSVEALVRLSLEAAEAAQKAGEQGVVEEAARSIVRCLACASTSTAAVGAWQAQHVRLLAGSRAALQSLGGSFSGSLQPLLRTSSGHRTLLNLLKELQQQHSSVLASGSTAQVAAAQAADDACEAIRARATSKTGAGAGSRFALLVFIACLAFAAVAISQSKPLQEVASSSGSGAVRAAMSSLSTVAQQLPPAVLNAAQEAATLAEGVHEKVQPLLQHLHEAMGRLYELLAAYSAQGLHAASVAQQAISARFHGLMES